MHCEESRMLVCGTIRRSLVRFAVPVFLALLLQAAYGAADLIVVGRFADAAELSGVASGSQFFNLITMAVTGLSMGVTVFVGGAVGAGRRRLAGLGIGCGIALFAALAVLVTAVTVPMAEALAKAVHAPAEAFAQTASYIRICGWGAVFIAAYNVIGAVFRGLGDSRTPLLAVAVACAVNIVGDLVLVAGCGMGAAGAAYATVGAQGVSVAFALWLILRRKKLPFSFSVRFIRFGRCCGPVLRVGVPIALQEILVQFSFLFIQVVVNGMGVVESAAVGVAERVCVFLMLVASAYMQAISAFVAQNNGAGEYGRSRTALVLGIRSAVAVGLLTGGLAYLYGDALAVFFSGDAQVIARAHDYLRAYAPDCLLTALLFCCIGYFNGCGRTVFVMLQGVIGAFCVRLPAVWLIGGSEGVTLFHIGLATPLSSAVQIMLCVSALRAWGRMCR